MEQTMQATASTYPDFQLHSLGWKAFQDLCLVILEDQLGQGLKHFSPTKDGGRDGAFIGKWSPIPALQLKGETVIQCKFTSRAGTNLTPHSFKEDLDKARVLWQRRKRNNYVLLTNYNVTAEFEETLSRKFRKFGCFEFHVFGNEWLTKTILTSPRLRALVPRLYGLGDLSQILDERWYQQTRKLLEAEKDNLRKFVPTKSYRNAVNALNIYSVVILLGEPAIGKSAIAATLALASGDLWHCRPMKVDRPQDLRERWNPEDPKQLFWIDDAFGATQYDSSRTHDWNAILPWLSSIIKSGCKLILTSRTYIYSRAKKDLKQSSFPILAKSHVIVNVADMSLEEREQILYNHIRLGNQSKNWRKRFKPIFDTVARHPNFRPEVARRLGALEFTENLKLFSSDVSKFVNEPEDFLRETINGLSVDDKAALSAIFIRGGALTSPIDLTTSELYLISRLGSSLPGVIESLDAMQDTFVRLDQLGEDKWIFIHPTIADALSSIIADNAELVDLYLLGASMSKVFLEVTCGRVHIQGAKVIVPPSRFDLVVKRIQDYLMNSSSSNPPLWRRRDDCYAFLANRCSKEFLLKYIDSTSKFWETVLSFGSYLSAMPQFRLIVRLRKDGLLTQEHERLVIEKVKELAIETPDSDFLTVPWIRAFFTDKEIDIIMQEVESKLVPNLDSLLRDWLFNYSDSEDPAGYYEPLLNALHAYTEYFSDNPKIKQKLISANDDVGSDIDSLPHKKDDDEDIGFELSGTPPVIAQSKQSRRIFDDIDE